jgi:hypothetical protein
MIVRPGIYRHWKYRKLSSLSGFEYPIVWLTKLWGHCEEQRRCTLPADPDQLAGICEYPGPSDSRTFTDWLIQSGFLDFINGEYQVHQWNEYNRTLINSWNNGAKGGRPPKRTIRNGEITYVAEKRPCPKELE